MLVLSRKVGQSIVIGEPGNQVTVCVTRIVGNRVTLGIDAPKEMHIIRAELDRRDREPAEVAQ